MSGEFGVDQLAVLVDVAIPTVFLVSQEGLRHKLVALVVYQDGGYLVRVLRTTVGLLEPLALVVVEHCLVFVSDGADGCAVEHDFRNGLGVVVLALGELLEEGVVDHVVEVVVATELAVF